MDVAALLAAAKTSGPTGSGSVEALFAAAKSAQGRGCEEALLKAARAGDLEQLKLVIDSNKGLNLNCRGSWDGQTALGWPDTPRGRSCKLPGQPDMLEGSLIGDPMQIKRPSRHQRNDCNRRSVSCRQLSTRTNVFRGTFAPRTEMAHIP